MIRKTHINIASKLLNLLLLCLSFSLYATEHISFASHLSPPISTYLKDVLQTALTPYNIKVSLYELPGRRVIEQVNNGFIDGDSGRIINFKEISNDTTSNYRLVKEPILSAKLVLITLKSTPIDDINWVSINTGAVAYKSGSKLLRKNIKEENRISMNKNLSLLKMVAIGRAKSAITFNAIAKSLLDKNPELKSKLLIHPKPIKTFNHYVYLNKKHKKLIPLLKKALKKLSKEGTLNLLAKKHGVSPPIKLSF